MILRSIFYFSLIVICSKNVLIKSSTVQNSSRAANISECEDVNLVEIDERIAKALKNPEDYVAQETQLMKDIFEYYHYLSKMTASIDKENNNKLLKIVLSHPPQFIAVHFDDERFLKAFSWTQDQLDDFNRAFEGSFLLWQRLESMGKM